MTPAPDEPEKLELDFESLTFGELCDIEDAVGADAAATLVSKTPSPKALTGAIWIIKRRADPNVTFDQVKALTIMQVDFA